MIIARMNTMSSGNIAKQQFKPRQSLNAWGLVSPSPSTQTGSGLIPSVARDALKDVLKNPITSLVNAIPASDENARPLFPGEKHAMLQLPSGKMSVASFMGPNTNILARLTRGDPPRTNSDAVAQMHDIQYSLASAQPTKELQLQKIREADERMVKSLEKIKDTAFNKNVGKRLIQGKMLAEDAGLLSREKFAGPLKKYSDSDMKLLTDNRDKLIQEGYGAEKPVGYDLKKKLIRSERRSKGKLPKGMRVEKALVGSGVADMIPSLVQKALSKLGVKSSLPSQLLSKVIEMVKPKLENVKLPEIVKVITKAITPIISSKYAGLTGSGYSSVVKDKHSMNKLYGHVSKYVLNSVRGKQLGSGFWKDFVKGVRMVLDPVAKIAGIIPNPLMGVATAYNVGTNVLDKTNLLK